jgi:hypothetical protein
MMTKLLRTTLAAALIAGCAGAPALAAGSIGGGIYTQSGNGTSSTGPGLILSSTDPVPLLPATVGITGFVPLATGGGYAVTVDGTFSFVNNAIGVGYGIGQFGSGHSGGTGTIFLDRKIAPFTSLELRGYKTFGTDGSTAFFGGVKFSL